MINFNIKKSLYEIKRLYPYPFTADMFSMSNRIKHKGELIMKNRSFIIGLASTGLATQVFTLICTGALQQNYIDVLNAVSAITLFLALILNVYAQPCPLDKIRERDEMYRDFDDVYRQIENSARDLREEIRDCGRNCQGNCKIGKK